jgi:programmed cell death protein 5
MDNLQLVSNIDPNDFPEGFSVADPNSSAGGGGKHGLLEQALTPDALARLRRIKLVKRGKAAAVENAIVTMVVSGKLSAAIIEGKLTRLLERGNAKKRREPQRHTQNSI